MGFSQSNSSDCFTRWDGLQALAQTPSKRKASATLLTPVKSIEARERPSSPITDAQARRNPRAFNKGQTAALKEDIQAYQQALDREAMLANDPPATTTRAHRGRSDTKDDVYHTKDDAYHTKDDAYSPTSEEDRDY